MTKQCRDPHWPHLPCECLGDVCPYAAPATALPPTNPKQAYGDKKLPLYLVPFTFVAHVCTAMLEGMLKYGLANWRAAPVEAMTYVSALQRHAGRWMNGEREDPDTGVHHLASAAACLCILLDAEANGTLIDNRPLGNPGVDKLVADLEATVAKLREIHKDKTPVHYTQASDATTEKV
jgi:hypothetical protein